MTTQQEIAMHEQKLEKVEEISSKELKEIYYSWEEIQDILEKHELYLTDYEHDSDTREDYIHVDMITQHVNVYEFEENGVKNYYGSDGIEKWYMSDFMTDEERDMVEEVDESVFETREEYWEYLEEMGIEYHKSLKK